MFGSPSSKRPAAAVFRLPFLSLLFLVLCCFVFLTSSSVVAVAARSSKGGGGGGRLSGKCSPGERLVQSPALFHSNGCGAGGLTLNLDSSGDPVAFEGCCDQHDACYSICGISKSICEQDFKKCLDNVCRKSKKQKKSRGGGGRGGKDLEEEDGCSGLAQMMVMGTSFGGQSFFEQAQEDACECASTSSSIDTTRDVDGSTSTGSTSISPESSRSLSNAQKAYIDHADRIYSNALFGKTSAASATSNKKQGNSEDAVVDASVSKKNEKLNHFRELLISAKYSNKEWQLMWNLIKTYPAAAIVREKSNKQKESHEDL